MKTKNKIFFLLPRLSVGGAERIALSLATGLYDFSYEIKFLCLKPTEPSALFLEKVLTDHGIELIVLGKNKRFDIKAWSTLYKLLRLEKPEVLHSQLFSADICGRVIGHLAGIKVIVSTIQNLNDAEGQIRRSLRFLTRSLSSAVIAVSETVKNHVVNWECPPQNKLTVIYNGIPVGKFKPISKSINSQLIIGGIGRLTLQKGFDQLIKALKLVDFPFHCYIVGEGEDRDSLQQLIIANGQESKITLTGSQSDIATFLNSVDIFVLPSRWEGLPLVLLEAGASGKPSIVSNAGSNLEVIENNKNGLVFTTIEELSVCLKNLYTNPELRQQLAENLRHTVISKFSAKAMVENYHNLYQDLLDGRVIKSTYESITR